MYELGLTVKRCDDGQYLVADDLPATHGIGQTVRAALDDYLSALNDHWTDLRANEGRLAPRLAAQLDYLNELLDPLECWFELTPMRRIRRRAAQTRRRAFQLQRQYGRFMERLPGRMFRDLPMDDDEWGRFLEVL